MRVPRLRSALLVVACSALLQGPAGARSHEPATGLRNISYAHPPPNVVLDVGSGPQRLSALYGKPIVLNFWATWCAPCLDELDTIARVRSEYGDAVRVVTVSWELPGVARSYLIEHHYDLPVVEDPDKKIFGAMSVERVPVTMVLEPDGAVSHVSVGELDWNELHAALAVVLPEASPLPAGPATAGPSP